MSDSCPAGCPVKCMIIIVNRGMSEKIIEQLRAKNIMASFVLPAHGTATAKWQNLLGLGDTKKDVIITIINKDLVGDVFGALHDEMGIGEPGQGVAFTVNINSIGGKRLLNYCMGKVEE